MVFCERSEDNLMLMCLLGDVLFLLKVFQKKLQGDITIVDVIPETKKFIAKIDILQQRPIVGRWEASFHKAAMRKMKHFLGEFCGRKNDARPRRNLYVSESRAVSAIKIEVLQSLRNFMETRLNIDYHAKENFSSFVKFTASEADIREIHTSVAPDLDLQYLAQEYEDVQESTMYKTNPKALVQNIKLVCKFSD